MERSKKVSQANGEAVPRPTDPFLYDILTVPDLAAVEASFDRSRLLLQQGIDAAMALDASNSIQASNRLERMLAHQMAAIQHCNNTSPLAIDQTPIWGRPGC